MIKIKRQDNAKTDICKFLTRAPTELLVGLLLSSIPVIYHTNSKEDANNIINLVLAPPPIINHATLLLGLYTFIFLYKYFFGRFRSERLQKVFYYICTISAEVGTSFLTIIRAGLGAIIGYGAASLYIHDIQLSRSQYFELAFMFLTTLLFSAWIAMTHEFLAAPAGSNRYKNPLKFDKNMRR